MGSTFVWILAIFETILKSRIFWVLLVVAQRVYLTFSKLAVQIIFTNCYMTVTSSRRKLSGANIYLSSVDCTIKHRTTRSKIFWIAPEAILLSATTTLKSLVSRSKYETKLSAHWVVWKNFRLEMEKRIRELKRFTVFLSAFGNVCEAQHNLNGPSKFEQVKSLIKKITNEMRI